MLRPNWRHGHVERRTLWLVVDALGEIAEVFEDRLNHAARDGLRQTHMFADAALALNDVDDNDFIIVLNADRLYASLSNNGSGVAIAA